MAKRKFVKQEIADRRNELKVQIFNLQNSYHADEDRAWYEEESRWEELSFLDIVEKAMKDNDSIELTQEEINAMWDKIYEGEE